MSFQNDPCDEWPVIAIRRAVGLLMCGHKTSALASVCPKCVAEAKYGSSFRDGLAASPLTTFETPGPITGRMIERASGAE